MRRICVLFLCLLLMFCCAAAAETDSAVITCLDDLKADGVRIGVLTGSTMDQITADAFPKAECKYLDTLTDLVQMLLSGNIEAFLYDEPVIRALENEAPTVTHLKEPVSDIRYGLAFAKTDEGKALCDTVSAFIAESRENGLLDELDAIWFGRDESKKTVSMDGLTGENGTLRIATSDSNMPFSYIKENQQTGFLVDLIYRFCAQNGYAIEWQSMVFNALIPALSSGKCDIMLDATSITEERMEQVYFSEPYYIGGMVAAVRKPETVEASEIAAYNGKVIGVETGSTDVELVERLFPDSKYAYYNEISALAVALKSGNIDAFPCNFITAKDMLASQSDLRCIPIEGEGYSVAFAFPKNESGARLRDQMNEFLRKIRAEGTLDALYENWISDGAAKNPIDFSNMPTGGKTLSFATSGTYPPNSYFMDGQAAGLDVDIAVRFCREYGYGIDIQYMSLPAMLAGTAAGRYDFLGDGIYITEERKESLFFSDPHFISENALVVLDTKSDAFKTGFFQSLEDSFEKTFIREDRWKLIAQGIGTTCVITLFSAILGTILGFGICMLRRMRNPFACGFAKVYIRIMQGTPIVVLLMILFYIVFAKSGFSGELVAIIGFSLNFAAYVSEIIRSGIDAVNVGQMEAALALGYTKSQAFFQIILPQAARHFLPVYKGEFVSLVKSTSIVGYIAVQDLTKMSDIVRSRTYEAFFPLIATAIIYFIIAGLLTALLNRVQVHIEPNRERRSLKGVKMQ